MVCKSDNSVTKKVAFDPLFEYWGEISLNAGQAMWCLHPPHPTPFLALEICCQCISVSYIPAHLCRSFISLPHSHSQQCQLTSAFKNASLITFCRSCKTVCTDLHTFCRLQEPRRKRGKAEQVAYFLFCERGRTRVGVCVSVHKEKGGVCLRWWYTKKS